MKDNQPNVDSMKESARAIRRSVVEMVARTGAGYVQQGLGAADLFTFVYFAELRFDETDIRDLRHGAASSDWPDRDRLVLSTAHNSAVFYATLAERGLIDKSRLSTYCTDGSELEVNVSERLGPLVECTCGSLGQGLSVAVGMAQAGKRRGLGFRTYVILGDGELQEGQTWEAAMYAGSNGLDNLCLIVDVNGLQVEGETDSVLDMAPIDDKWRAFGWAVRDVDGHDFSDLSDAFDWARETSGRPSVLLVRTLVGKGVPFLEGQKIHHLVFPAAVAARALAELEETT